MATPLLRAAFETRPQRLDLRHFQTTRPFNLLLLSLIKGPISTHLYTLMTTSRHDLSSLRLLCPCLVYIRAPSFVRPWISYVRKGIIKQNDLGTSADNPHASTSQQQESDRLRQCYLTSVIRRELVCSKLYGRRHLLREN